MAVFRSHLVGRDQGIISSSFFDCSSPLSPVKTAIYFSCCQHMLIEEPLGSCRQNFGGNSLLWEDERGK